MINSTSNKINSNSIISNLVQPLHTKKNLPKTSPAPSAPRPPKLRATPTEVAAKSNFETAEPTPLPPAPWAPCSQEAAAAAEAVRLNSLVTLNIFRRDCSVSNIPRFQESSASFGKQPTRVRNCLPNQKNMFFLPKLLWARTLWCFCGTWAKLEVCSKYQRTYLEDCWKGFLWWWFLVGRRAVCLDQLGLVVGTRPISARVFSCIFVRFGAFFG